MSCKRIDRWHWSRFPSLCRDRKMTTLQPPSREQEHETCSKNNVTSLWLRLRRQEKCRQPSKSCILRAIFIQSFLKLRTVPGTLNSGYDTSISLTFSRSRINSSPTGAKLKNQLVLSTHLSLSNKEFFIYHSSRLFVDATFVL